MNAIEKRARELLVEKFRRHGYEYEANQILEGKGLTPFTAVTLNAINAALTPPEGYVLVPVVLPEPMLDALYRAEGDMNDADMQALWADMLAARPEVTP